MNEEKKQKSDEIKEFGALMSVSYTHLTLPTKLEV